MMNMKSFSIILAWTLAFGCAAPQPKVGDLPNIVPARLGIIDSRTYTAYLEKAKGYERLENLLKQELSTLQLAEISIRSGISLADGEKETIRSVFSQYGSADPLGDFFRMHQIDVENNTCDPEGKCYLLDDLANLYSHLLVDFKKAQDANRKAEDLYRRIAATGIEKIPVSDCYNLRRSLYNAFFYRMEGVQPPGFGPFPGRIDLISPYGKEDLETIRRLDFENLGERIREREAFLRLKLEAEAGAAKAKDFRTIGFQGFLMDEMERFLSESGRYDRFEAAFYIAENAYQAYAVSGDDRYLPKIIAFGAQALETPRKSSLAVSDAVNRLHFWVGLACLKSDRASEGIDHMEEFIQGIDAYESLSRQTFEKRQAVLDRVNQQAIEKGKRDAAWSKVFIVAALAAGAYNTAQAYSQTQSGAMSMSDFNMIHKSYMDALGMGIQMIDQIQVGLGTLEQQAELSAEISRYVTPLALKVNRYMDKHQMVDYFLELGKAYQAVGSFEKALEHYEEAVRIIERQRSTVDTEKQRISFFAASQQLYERIVSLLVDMGRPEKALEYVERARSRAFVDLLGSRRLKLKTDAQTEGYLERVLQLSEIDALLSEKQVGVSQLKQVLQKAQRGLQVKAKSSGKTGDLELMSLSDVGTLGAGDIRKLARDGRLILEYFFAGPRLFLFIVDSDSVRVVQLSAGAQELARSAESWRQKLLARADARDLENYFYDALISPVNEKIQGRSIIVIPHGVLHYLPFQAMHDGRQYLIEQCAVSYSPSATVLKFTHEKPALGTGKLLVFANPTRDLAFAEQEARQIASLYPGATLLAGDQATETLFKNQGSEFDILHLAAHGLFEEQEPLNSCIVLGRDGDNDGSLRTSELFSLQLRASLVTLSACDTGLSVRRSGDELIGLQRGLIFAGARSVVSSLWPVDDASTSDLMQAFYRNLQTMDKSRALQLAQQDAMRRYAHPYFWAAFNLTGDSM